MNYQIKLSDYLYPAEDLRATKLNQYLNNCFFSANDKYKNTLIRADDTSSSVHKQAVGRLFAFITKEQKFSVPVHYSNQLCPYADIFH